MQHLAMAKLNKLNLYLLLFLLISCSSKKNNLSDKFLNKIPNKYAKGFQLYETENGYWVEIFHPQTKEKLDEILIESTSLKNVITFSSTHIGFIELLDEINTVKGVTYPAGIFNTNIKKGIKKGEVLDIGSDVDPNKESILSLNPDIVFTFPNSASFEWMNMLDIKNIVVTEFLEPHPLAQAEWIRFFGYLYGKPKTADSIFHEIDKGYNELIQEKAYSFKVMAGQLYDDSWATPGGKSTTSILLQDAGAQYISFGDSSYGSHSIDYEIILEEQSKINFLVMLTFNYQEITKESLLSSNTKYQFLKFLDTKKMVVCNSALYPYFEKGITQPHILLKELINVFEDRENENYYFKPID